MATIETSSNKLSWGEFVNLVPISPTERKSIVKDYNSITLQQVQSHAFFIWEDKSATSDSDIEILDPVGNLNDRTIFYLQVWSKMIAKRLQNSINAASWKSLLQKQTDFAWLNQKGSYDYDGPTMLKISFSLLIQEHVSSSRNWEEQFGPPVFLIINTMFRRCVMIWIIKIIRKEETHDNYKRWPFWSFIIINEWDLSKLHSKASGRVGKRQRYHPRWYHETGVAKYNNMLKRKIWIQSETQESKLVALATKLQQMENQLKNQLLSILQV